MLIVIVAAITAAPQTHFSIQTEGSGLTATADTNRQNLSITTIANIANKSNYIEGVSGQQDIPYKIPSSQDNQSMGTSGGSHVVVLLVLLAAVLTTVTAITCVVSHLHHQRHNHRGSAIASTPLAARIDYDSRHQRRSSRDRATVPMLALEANLERERLALRDRQVRMHSVHRDFQMDLPPMIQLPDGEEIPYGSSIRLHIRDPEQESEIYQKCIRPPPNRTIYDSENVIPFRSSSAGFLPLNGSPASSASSSTDWTHSVVRCNSMSSRFNNPSCSLPPVILPANFRSRHKHHSSATAAGGLAKIPMVPCRTDQSKTGVEVVAAAVAADQSKGKPKAKAKVFPNVTANPMQQQHLQEQQEGQVSADPHSNPDSDQSLDQRCNSNIRKS